METSKWPGPEHTWKASVLLQAARNTKDTYEAAELLDEFVNAVDDWPGLDWDSGPGDYPSHAHEDEVVTWADRLVQYYCLYLLHDCGGRECEKKPSQAERGGVSHLFDILWRELIEMYESLLVVRAMFPVLEEDAEDEDEDGCDYDSDDVPEGELSSLLEEAEWSSDEKARISSLGKALNDMVMDDDSDEGEDEDEDEDEEQSGDDIVMT